MLSASSLGAKYCRTTLELNYLPLSWLGWKTHLQVIIFASFTHILRGTQFLLFESKKGCFPHFEAILHFFTIQRGFWHSFRNYEIFFNWEVFWQKLWWMLDGGLDNSLEATFSKVWGCFLPKFYVIYTSICYHEPSKISIPKLASLIQKEVEIFCWPASVRCGDCIVSFQNKRSPLCTVVHHPWFWAHKKLEHILETSETVWKLRKLKEDEIKWKLRKIAKTHLEKIVKVETILSLDLQIEKWNISLRPNYWIL